MLTAKLRPPCASHVGNLWGEFRIQQKNGFSTTNTCLCPYFLRHSTNPAQYGDPGIDTGGRLTPKRDTQPRGGHALICSRPLPPLPHVHPKNPRGLRHRGARGGDPKSDHEPHTGRGGRPGGDPRAPPGHRGAGNALGQRQPPKNRDGAGRAEGAPGGVPAAG